MSDADGKTARIVARTAKQKRDRFYYIKKRFAAKIRFEGEQFKLIFDN